MLQLNTNVNANDLQDGYFEMETPPFLCENLAA